LSAATLTDAVRYSPALIGWIQIVVNADVSGSSILAQ
jgi:hypothetical protein